MLQAPEAAAMLSEFVEDAIPWSQFLPEADRSEFVTQFVRMIRACAEFDDFAPVGTLLRQWKNTAEVWANPALRAALEADIEEGPVVERPAAPA